MTLLSSSDDDIALAAKALSGGSLVAFPTETVYGLGGDAFNVTALAGIFKAKNRPFFDPLIIHVAAIDALDRIVLWDALEKSARKKFDLLTNKFWPGPLTLILPGNPLVPGLVNAGLSSVAVRFPSNVIAQKLIRLSTGAVAAPSANPFGCLSPTRAEHVISQLGDKVDFIIDGGRTDVGLESTVLDITCEPCELLRPGGISRGQIEELTGPVKFRPHSEDAPVSSPGRLKSHYAPRTPLSLHSGDELISMPMLPGEGRLFFSAPPCALTGCGAGNGFTGGGVISGVTGSGARIKILSAKGDAIEAAANFFDMLHDLDKLGLSVIRAEEAPPDGLGAAINDRLRRASAR